MKGRPFDIEDETTSLEGATNYILVDRNNILKTGLDEISSIDDPRITLEVAFYGEVQYLQYRPLQKFVMYM